MASSTLPQLTLGQRAAETAAAFVGSWPFLIAFNIFVTVWCGINVFNVIHPFDPYPFTLLNLVFSWLAGVQAPMILIAQNRQEEISQRTQQETHDTTLRIERMERATLAMVESFVDLLSDNAAALRAIKKQLDDTPTSQ